MVLSFCCACGVRSGLESHHLIPRCEGGTDDETNLLTLCSTCHGHAHGMIRKDISALTKAGLARARERGVVLGNPKIREIAIQGTAAASARLQAKREAIEPVVRQILGELRCTKLTADALNHRGVKTVSGNDWTARQVGRFLNACKRAS